MSGHKILHYVGLVLGIYLVIGLLNFLYIGLATAGGWSLSNLISWPSSLGVGQ